VAASTIVLVPTEPNQADLGSNNESRYTAPSSRWSQTYRLSRCSSFLATRVLSRRNRPNENRSRFPNRLPYKRSCLVSAAERCGRKNSADGGC
jgi:hypothetical protein